MDEEERKGHAKVSVEVEINEPLMDIMEESLTKVPQMMKLFEQRQKKRGE